MLCLLMVVVDCGRWWHSFSLTPYSIYNINNKYLKNDARLMFREEKAG